MYSKRMRNLRRATIACLGAGVLFQAGPCTPDQFIAVTAQIVTQEMANLLSDTIFFFFDNIFVRLRG